ncbi:MAG: ATP-dependent DNA helicase RecG [Deltaproteobacteria bacterium]|nr:MAG: ATP-dependent DNA helicase RecG [Deltaproteobacteria bacterium]
MPIDVVTVSAEDRDRIFARHEGHFLDMKSALILPASLTKTICAFANADGGELFVGIDEDGDGTWRWNGFAKPEDANAHLQVFEEFFPLGGDFRYEFLECPGETGFVLHATILKVGPVKSASNGKVYVRRGAQNLSIVGPEPLRALQLAKGVISHEDSTLASVPVADVTNSERIIEFMLDVVPNANPEQWLPKQRLVVDGKPTVASVLLFADAPQAYLPKAAVKLYRYKTTALEGTRETLAFNPVTIEGTTYDLIYAAVADTVAAVEQIQIMTDEGLMPVLYPHESLHEIITNAVLHRDYAVNDDVHVRVFDNRVEVESPGRLPAHITPSNILAERFARNPKIVRMVNRFPDPPNKDVGEGLNTAFRAMRKLRLRDPQIIERENSVLVLIRHETLASPEQQIIEHLQRHGIINNSSARDATGIESEVKVRALFKKLISAGEIEQVPGTARSTTVYRIPSKA